MLADLQNLIGRGEPGHSLNRRTLKRRFATGEQLCAAQRPLRGFIVVPRRLANFRGQQQSNQKKGI
jgi:hypothetical protein